MAVNSLKMIRIVGISYLLMARVDGRMLMERNRAIGSRIGSGDISCICAIPSRLLSIQEMNKVT